MNLGLESCQFISLSQVIFPLSKAIHERMDQELVILFLEFDQVSSMVSCQPISNEYGQTDSRHNK